MDIDSLPKSRRFNEINDALCRHISNDLDEPSAVLKSHLLTEQALRDFCRTMLPHAEHLEGTRLSFKQTLDLAHALRAVRPDDLDYSWVWRSTEMLNKLRNMYAHELDPSPEKLLKVTAELKSLISDNLDVSQADPDIPDLTVHLVALLGALLWVLDSAPLPSYSRDG